MVGGVIVLAATALALFVNAPDRASAESPAPATREYKRRVALGEVLSPSDLDTARLRVDSCSTSAVACWRRWPASRSPSCS
jgi:hypothetical protein